MGGASKIILVGATSLIVGIYAVSLKKVQANDISTSLLDVKRIQFERVQAAAVRTAMSQFVSLGGYDLTGSRLQLGGDTTFTYDFAYSTGSYSELTLTAYQRTQIREYRQNQLIVRDTLVPRVIRAKVQDTGGSGVKQGPRKIHRGTWQVTGYFVNRER